MTWFIFSILSVAALAMGELLQQRLLNGKDKFTPRTSAVLTFLFQSIFTIPIVLLTPLRSEVFSIFRAEILPQLLIVGLVASVGMIFYLKSFQVKNISLSTILVSSSVVVSTTIGIIFFSESVNSLKFLGIFLVLAAIISLNFKNSVLEKNHLFGLIAGFLFGISYSFDKSIVGIGDINPFIYIFWNFFFVAFFGFIFGAKEVISSIKDRKLTDFNPIVLSAVGYLLYNLCSFFAFVYGGEVGRVDAINNSEIFLIILFEYFILKHTQSVKRKLLTAIIAFAGVIILGIF